MLTLTGSGRGLPGKLGKIPLHVYGGPPSLAHQKARLTIYKHKVLFCNN